MKLEDLLMKYEPTIEFEVSELTDDEIKQLWKDCESAGLKFNRSERRYDSCIIHIFERG